MLKAPRLATAEFPLAHVTLVVRFCVEPSLKVPVAENAIPDPLVCAGFTGVTEIVTSDGGAGIEVDAPSVPCIVHAPLDVDCPHAAAASKTNARNFIECT